MHAYTPNTRGCTSARVRSTQNITYTNLRRTDTQKHRHTCDPKAASTHNTPPISKTCNHKKTHL
eukprot:JP447349.1.p4 GENE.JP447349.1~~JP447349.1.p4  ORF type:complete len:64 (-),score=4.94 JP447349.1:164-355(-)